MDLRNRKPLTAERSSNGHESSFTTEGTMIYARKYNSSFVYVGLVVFIFAVTIYWRSTSHLRTEQELTYGVIFDAGSTGSRVHIYKIANKFDLMEDVFEQIKPGLSSFAGNPKQGAESLIPLLDLAKKSVPAHLWYKTPILLKATAGLRLLPQKDADDLLEAVEALFRQYPFHVGKDAVHIIDGVEEGLYSWITVNYYNGAFADTFKLQGIIDLGGGSVQITFQPPKTARLAEVPEDHLAKVHLFGEDYTLYTKSYLGLGLKSAMMEILQISPDSSGTDLKSPCIDSSTTEKWRHANRDYTVSGSDAPLESRYDRCYADTLKVVSALQPLKIQKMASKAFCAISYFYDAGIDSSLVPENGGEILVSFFRDIAKKECASNKPTTPFLCLELVYMATLLEDGFGFDGQTPVLLAKKINGYEICWALGAMFDVMSRV